jgi:hypothetical protein
VRNRSFGAQSREEIAATAKWSRFISDLKGYPDEKKPMRDQLPAHYKNVKVEHEQR